MKFSGHSFRWGAASSATAMGFNDYEIQQLGRWHSDSYKLYVDSLQAQLLSPLGHYTWSGFKPLAPHFASSVA